MKNAAKTIMLVDDDPVLLATCGAKLEELGYAVIIARSGDQALRQLRAQNIDAVLLDILMPDKDGIETLLEMKKMKSSVRIYVMSGGGRAGLTTFLDIAMQFGADGQLRKPLTVADMVECLKAPESAVWEVS